MLDKPKSWYERKIGEEPDMYIPHDPLVEENMWRRACDYFGVEYQPLQPNLEGAEDSCLIDEFFRQHPECTTACISCSCPKCSPKC